MDHSVFDEKGVRVGAWNEILLILGTHWTNLRNIFVPFQRILEREWGRKKYLSSEELLGELQSEIMIIPSLLLSLSDTYKSIFRSYKGWLFLSNFMMIEKKK